MSKKKVADFFFKYVLISLLRKSDELVLQSEPNTWVLFHVLTKQNFVTFWSFEFFSRFHSVFLWDIRVFFGFFVVKREFQGLLLIGQRPGNSLWSRLGSVIPPSRQNAQSRHLMTRRLGSLRLCRLRRAVSGGDVLLNGRGKPNGGTPTQKSRCKIRIAGTTCIPQRSRLQVSRKKWVNNPKRQLPCFLFISNMFRFICCSSAAVQKSSFKVIAWKHFLSCWSAELREHEAVGGVPLIWLVVGTRVIDVFVYAELCWRRSAEGGEHLKRLRPLSWCQTETTRFHL